MKKIVAFVAVVMLIISVLSVTAMADGGEVLTINVTSSVSSAKAGDSFTLTFDAVYNGSSGVKGLQFTAVLPDGLTYAEGTAQATYPGGGTGTFSKNKYVGLNMFSTTPVKESWTAVVVTVTTSVDMASIGPKSIGVTDVRVTDINNKTNTLVKGVAGTAATVTFTHDVHKWDNSKGTPDADGWVITEEASCKDGKAERQCTVEGCEYHTVQTKTLPGDPSQHVLGDYQQDATSHWKVCSVCGETVGKVGHDIQVQINESDNTHSDHCKVCGWDGDHKAHASDEWVPGEDTHYKNCDTCGAKFDEARHAAAAGATWEKDSKEHYHYCDTCDAKIDVAEHTPGSDLVEIKPATCTEPGLGNFTCKECGQELSSAPIPATGHKKPDASQIQEVEPTCEEDGYIKYQCQNADHEVVEPSGKTALGHDMPEEWTVIKDATYLEKGEESRKCSRYDQCKHEEKQDIDVLPLDSDHLTVKPIVRGLDESVGAGVKAQIENFVKDYAKTGKHGPEVSDKFADAVMAALEGSEPIEIEVTVALDDVAANKLPASFNDAPGALLDSKQLTITAKVNGTAVDGDILSALPAPAAFSINKKYPNLIGLMNYGDEKGYSGLEFTKDGDVTTASALEVGYYALYTTSDLRWAEIFFDETNVFNGSAVEPKVRIVVNGKELDPSYYTISYKNNDKVGTGEFSIELTAEGEAAGFTLAEPIVNDFEITAAPAKPTTKPAEKDKSQSDVPATGDETNVVLYAAVMVLCTAALALVLLRKKSSR